jgi:hypothetical protein
MRIGVPRRAATSWKSFFSSSQAFSAWLSSHERMSTVKCTPSGMMLRELGLFWISPTVATMLPPTSSGSRLVARIISAAAHSASCRPSMGVGPTWFASPVRCTSYQCRHRMPFGAPMVFFWRSSIGPCSMWNS